MPEHQDPPQNTFVVRFWWEWHGESSDPARGWRGRVEHVQSGEGTAFRDVCRLLAFIERFVPSLESQAAGDIRSEE